MSLGRAATAPAWTDSGHPALGTVPRVGERRRSLRLPPLAVVVGPAFVAAIAYVDPGNIAVNLQAAHQDGYLLLWVVVTASVLAGFVQYQAASLGVASGRGLAELCAQRLPLPARLAMWAQCELVAAATDVAEFVGAAVGINLLFGIPLLPAGFLTAAVTFGVLAMRSRRGASLFEATVAGLLVVISACFVYETLRVGPSPRQAVVGMVPSLTGPGALLLAVGIVGATVMPHAVYLHSHLAACQADGLSPIQRSRLLRRTRRDVATALGLAAAVNIAMLLVAADLFRPGLYRGALDFTAADHVLAQRLGGGAAVVFAVALLASGISSSGVGTLAGQIVMASFTRRHIPVATRRAITILPALALLAWHANLTVALMATQAVLSFGIPFAVIPLVALTADRQIMGAHTTHPATTIVGAGIAAALVALNAVLLAQTV